MAISPLQPIVICKQKSSAPDLTSFREYCKIIRFFFFFFFGLFVFSRTEPVVYGGSQARSLIRAVVTGLRQNHSNADPRHICDLHTPQLTALLDP